MTQDNKQSASETAQSGGDQVKKGRAISDPKEVAQMVMIQIDQVNAKKDELTIAVKTLADTAKQLVRAYGNQQAQIAKLSEQVQRLEKINAKP